MPCESYCSHFFCHWLLFALSWCGPCKILIPRLESLVSEKDGKVILAKIDIDEHTDLAMDYEVVTFFLM